MTIYTSLEDALYNSVATMFPTARIIFALQNHPEPKTPYILINVLRMNPVGREETSGYGPLQSYAQVYEAQVVFEVIGEYESTMEVSDLAASFEFLLASPLMLEAYAVNNLSLMRRRSMERFARTRETKTYMCYQQTAFYAYAVMTTQDVGQIDSVVVGGNIGTEELPTLAPSIYRDAGQPGHIIESTLYIGE
jgi:hypothetical protein